MIPGTSCRIRENRGGVAGMQNHIPADAFEPDVDAWAPWSPEEVSRRFAAVRAPWYVAGGWAIDLFLGSKQRDHEDIEVAVPRYAFAELAAALTDHDLFTVGSGFAWPLEEQHQTSTAHQTWVRERVTGRWRLDIFREPSDGETWICRRDERIRLPYERLIARTAHGIPYACPEVILLFKAKAARPKDEQDLAAVLPKMGDAERHWLADGIAMVHPGHPWLELLHRFDMGQWNGQAG